MEDDKYLEFLALEERPFGLTPDTHFFYESVTHREAIKHLNFFLSQKEGFACIYGDVGTGKTVLSRIFIDSIDRKRYHTALILNPIMDETEFLREVLNELNVIHDKKTKREMFDILQHFLIDGYKKGKETVLIIDEAQLLSDETLELIRILSNLETPKEKILHTILFGQQELIEKLKEPRMRYISQRVTVIYMLKTLSQKEVGQYINHRLTKAGSKGFVKFKSPAINSIYELSKGYPRVVNMICDRCLHLLYKKSERVVDKGIVDEVMRDESLSTFIGKPVHKGMPVKIPYIIAIILVSIFALLLYFDIISIEKILDFMLSFKKI
ncbi:MAG: AAA family ATPase [Syntrophorhabdaceae bacterium]|nr:AAA family ATPase [Syntrophorhabdaceae bacterium]